MLAGVAWLGRALWVLCLLLCCLALLSLLLSASTPSVTPGFRGSFIAPAILLSTVGAIIASRRPENPIGWLFCAAGMGFGL